MAMAWGRSSAKHSTGTLDQYSQSVDDCVDQLRVHLDVVTVKPCHEVALATFINVRVELTNQLRRRRYKLRDHLCPLLELEKLWDPLGESPDIK